MRVVGERDGDQGKPDRGGKAVAPKGTGAGLCKHYVQQVNSGKKNNTRNV